MKKNGAVYIYSTIEYYSVYIHRHFMVFRHSQFMNIKFIEKSNILHVDAWNLWNTPMFIPYTNAPSQPPRRKKIQGTAKDDKIVKLLLKES